MKNLYLVKTNASTMVVMHDTEEKTATVLDTVETNEPGFTLATVEDVSAGRIFEDVYHFETWMGIACYDPEAPKIIEMIENWRGVSHD